MATTSDLIHTYTEQAAQAGVDYDQFGRFVRYGYVAYKWALPFHAAARLADKTDGPRMIGCGGARGPGKSHAILAQVGLDDCQRAPGLKVLFLRKVMKSAAESFDDVARRVFQRIPHQLHDGRVTFPNGSRILIGGFNNERDIDKYLGIEYDVIVIEESTQLTGAKIDKIRGSLRTSRADWHTRLYESTNPDGIGHLDFKRRYVEPYRRGDEKNTRFFPATYRDNPRTKQEYIEYLESLTGALGSAWRDGDWDAFEGMSFPMWSEADHVIKPFPLPAHWPKWRAVDFGTAAPFSCHWLARDTDTGRLFAYRETYHRNMTDTQQARLIDDLTPPDEHINITYADPAMWAIKSALGVFTSSAEEYAREGVILTKANNDRIQGKRNVDRALSQLPDGRPGLQVFDTCPKLIEQLGSLVSDPKNPEDVDTDQEDHAYDSLRYGLSNYNKQQQAKPTRQRHPLAAMKGM